jgi:PAS domain S-box-containing protein
MSQAQILIVEDEIIVARDLETRVRELGYDVADIASSGENAVLQAAETRPDLVLMDIRLSGTMDGVEAAEEIRAQFDIPVIYLTAYADDHTLKRAKITEPFGYILKPFETRELRSTIRMALHKHELERRLRESEARYRTVSELASDFAYAVHVQSDATTDLEWVTDAFTRITGFAPQEVFADGRWDAIVHADDRLLAEEHTATVLSGREALTEFRIIAKSGEPRWLSVHSRPERDGAENRVVRFIGAVQDITQQVRVEDELRRYRHHLEELVEQRTAELVVANAHLQKEIAEKVQTQQALQRRAEELHVLNTLGRRINASLSLEEVVGSALDEVMRCVAPDLALLHLRQGPRLLLTDIRPDNAEIWCAEADAHRVSQCLCGLAVSEGKPIYSRSIHTDPRCTREGCKLAGMHSFAAVPLVKGDDILAVLGIASATDRDFGERASFLEALAGGIATGLQNALLYQQAQDQATKLAQEVAERKQAEKVLRESEARYRLLVEHAPTGIYEVDLTRDKFIAVNDVMCERLGYTREELLSMSPTEILTDDSLVRFLERSAKVAAGEKVPQAIEYIVRGKDGREIWTMVNSRLTFEDGVPTRATSIAHDITERRNMEAQVRQRNQRLTALNTISAAAASSLEPDAVLHQILELTCQTLDAAGGLVLLPQPDTGEFSCAAIVGGNVDALHSTCLALGQGISGWVVQHTQAICVNDVRQDERWCDGIDQVTGFETRSLLCAPLMYHEEATGVIEIVNKREGEFTDDDLDLLKSVASIAAVALENARFYVTTRARAQELALLNEMGLTLTATLDRATIAHAALHQIRRLFGATGVMLFELDRQTSELYTVRALFGRQENEIPVRLAPGEGIAGWALAHRQATLVDDAQHDPRQSVTLNQYVASHLGDQVCAMMVAPLLGQDHDIGVIEVLGGKPGAYTRDDLHTLRAIASTLAVALENARLYDELSAAMEAHERTYAQLIQAEKVAALGRLLASLAHEINNPLQALRSSLNLLLNRDPPAEKRRIYLDLAHQEVERLVGIVERVLGFYRPSREGPEPVDIDATLDETLLLVHKQLERERVTVHRHRSVELPSMNAVAGQLKQVFLNLILNAVQAMPEGGELTVETRWDTSAHEVHIVFTDTGMGIPDDALSRLFEPFFTSRREGTGLGLTISYSIVEQHGGRIEVQSQVGVGSTFTAILPLAPPIPAAGVAGEANESPVEVG